MFHRTIGVLYRGRYTVVQAVQISEGGLLFTSREKRDVKSPIVLSLLVPGGFSIVARGELIYEVKNGSGFNYGVKFYSLGFHLKRIIRNYVSAKTQAEAEQEADEISSMS